MHSLSRSVLAFCRAATLLAAGGSLLLALASARGAELGTGEERDGNPATGVAGSCWTAPGLPEVALATVHGGGHTIPQPGTRFPALLGAHSEDIDVPAEAWIFFDGGTRPRRRP